MVPSKFRQKLTGRAQLIKDELVTDRPDIYLVKNTKLEKLSREAPKQG